MKWKTRSKGGQPSFLPRLLFLAACFFGGVCLGQVLAGRVPDEPGGEVGGDLKEVLAIVVLGLRCAVTLPCYFWLAVPALGTSGALASLSFGRGRRVAAVTYGREYWRRLAVCGAVLALALCVDLLCGPRILRFLLEHMFV